MENKETIFRVGDRVFDIQYGWGIVTDIDSVRLNMLKLPIRVEFENEVCFYTSNGKDMLSKPKSMLSFKEYTLVGFSQERPIEIPNRGQICWVRDTHTGKWVISHFLRMFDGKFITSNTIDDINYSTWNYLTTKNPYENE